MTLPSPTVLQYRVGPKPIQDGIYKSTEEMLHDLGLAYRKAIKAFGDAGCRYLQLDDTSYAHLCDKERRAALQARGEDPIWLANAWADMINSALKDKPADMVTAMHLCRGNFRSTFVSSGGYEPVADVLFNKIGIDGYFLEYDSDRAGSFEPLRFLPKGKKRVVLGLVTSKTGTLESKDILKKRIEEATKFVPLDQLCLSPQCGFASTEEGNVLAEDEQWAKLRLCVEVAEEVWGNGPVVPAKAGTHTEAAAKGPRRRGGFNHSSRIATARVQPAEPPFTLTGKHDTVNPSAGRLSRLCSFSIWQ